MTTVEARQLLKEYRLKLQAVDEKLEPWRDEQELSRSEEMVVMIMQREYIEARSQCLRIQQQLFVP